MTTEASRNEPIDRNESETNHDGLSFPRDLIAFAVGRDYQERNQESRADILIEHF